MLQKKKSKAIWQLKYVVLLPLVLGMLVYTSCEVGKEDDKGELNTSIPLAAVKRIPFGVVDEAPIFPSCEDAEDKRACFVENLQKHIGKHFNYPKEAQERGIQGRVAVIFTIDANGKIVDIRKRGPHELLENEAVRIIEKLPQMQPGKQDGRVVNVAFSVPIAFQLENGPEVRVDAEAQKIAQKISDMPTFSNIDEAPIFPGCENAVDKKACFMESVQTHIRNHFNYPKEAQELGVEGKVYVIFNIDANGAITDIRSRGPHELLEAEAERIIKQLPVMQPGKQKGHVVGVPFSIPITFKLQ